MPTDGWTLGDSDVAPICATRHRSSPAPRSTSWKWTTGSIDCIVFDPPYHNNVNYAELSDFFYVWLKRTAGYVFPEYFTEHLLGQDERSNRLLAQPASGCRQTEAKGRRQ